MRGLAMMPLVPKFAKFSTCNNMIVTVGLGPSGHCTGFTVLSLQFTLPNSFHCDLDKLLQLRLLLLLTLLNSQQGNLT